jgi:Ser/Thr protein kinase RdoA (MazF antagonist)
MRRANCCAICNWGPELALRGIEGGIENTNYFLTSDQGEFVLTLFERLTAEQLPFYLYLMKHLARHGMPVPDPRPDQNGDILHSVCGKPAAVVNKLRGKSQLAPQPVHCAAVGTMLARMHLAGRDLRPPPAQPARPALVERNRARGAAPHWPRAGRAAARRAGLPEPCGRFSRPMPRCHAGRCMPTCSATT